MRNVPGFCLLAVVGCLGLLVAQGQAPADVVIVNARIYTGDSTPGSTQFPEALAISGDRITMVGDAAAAKLHTGPGTRVIDAAGRLVIPGINDAHTHPGAMPPHTSLEGPPAMEHDPTFAEIVDRLTAAVAKAPAGQWIIGEIGAAVQFDPKATRFALDALSGDHPVMLIAFHGHGTLVNTRGLRALDVSDTEPDPPGGRFGRMPDGKTLNGRAEEYAEYILRQRLMMIPDEKAQLRAFQRFAREAASYGITTAQAMMTSYPSGRVPRIIDGANLPVRLRLIEFPTVAPSKWGMPSEAAQSPMAGSGVKYIVDGTPIERLMFLRAPYSDAPSTRGRLNFDAGEFPAFLRRALAARVQPMFHASGDAAIDMVLNALAESGGEQWTAVRPRIEHGDLLDPAQFERARRMGVVLVQNPSHFMLPDIMQARLGDRRLKTAAVKSAMRAGVLLAFGSDGPLNPYLNMMFATMNPTNPTEALTVEEAFAAYTRGSAVAEGRDRATGSWMEQQKGTLTRGKLADLAILSQDIFTVPASDLPKTTSVLTIVGGRVVHEAKQER